MEIVKKSINVSKVIPDTCLEVIITGIKIFNVRLFIGIRLLKLAAWVIGCQIVIKNK